MKNVLKTSLVSLTVLALLMSSACGKANTTDPVKTTDKTTTVVEETNKLPDLDPYHKYSPAIVMTTAKNVTDDKSYPEGEDPQNNIIYKSIENNMGIKFENKFSGTFDAYIEKVKLSIASNDIPDMMMVTATELNLLIKGDMIEDLKPLYDKYATQNLKNSMEYRDKICLSPVTRGDKLYGMPSVTDANNGVVELYMRSDWMKALNIQQPKTMDELFAIAKAFTENDPDKNGKKDTFGFAMHRAMYSQLYGFMNAFGAYPQLYLKDAEGKFTYGSLDPKVKTVLGKISQGYKEGLFDKEFASKDIGKMAESIAAGKVGIIFGEFYYPLWPLVDSHKNNKNADWECYPIPTADGSAYVPTAPINASVFYTVRKGYEHPEALIIAMNHFGDQLYGDYSRPFGTDWNKMQADPKYASLGIHNWMPFFYDRPDANVAKYKLYQEVLDTGSTEKLDAGQLQLWKNNVKPGLDGDDNNWPWPRVYFGGVKVIASYEEFKTTEYFGPPTETSLKNGPTLQKLEEEYFLNIMTGSKPVDEFDNFVKQWNELGGSKVLEEMNAYK